MLLSLLAIMLSFSFPGEIVAIEGVAQGTTYTIRFVPGRQRVEKAQIDSIFKVIDRSLSLYDPQSLINQFNREGSVFMDHHMKQVVTHSFRVYRESGGAFDITTATLSKAWGFGPGVTGRLPSKKAIRKALALTGMDKLGLRGDTLIALKRGVQIDCNGIAQGYSVDVIMEFLSSHGIRQMLVEVGGEVSVRGDQPETGNWRIGVESVEPIAGEWRPVDSILLLKDKAVTTSGNYRKYFTKGDVSYSHVIDPALGRPVDNGVIAVTVIADDAMTADAWDNAFFVMGVDATAKYIQQRKNLGVLMIWRQPDGTITKFTSVAK